MLSVIFTVLIFPFFIGNAFPRELIRVIAVSFLRHFVVDIRIVITKIGRMKGVFQRLDLSAYLRAQGFTGLPILRIREANGLMVGCRKRAVAVSGIQLQKHAACGLRNFFSVQIVCDGKSGGIICAVRRVPVRQTG